jgi:hypothetical protein
VLANRAVELYLVLSTRNRFAAGDWAAYEASGRLELNEPLSALLLPPEIDPVVLTFRRPKA